MVQLGLGFIAGSIVAQRNRRYAGVIFLSFMPIAAFCLAYPDAGFLVWDTYGNGLFETPIPSTAIWLTVLFFTPFLVAVLAIRHRKRAVYLFFTSACIAGVVFGMSHWTRVLLPRLAAWSAPFLVFALFWLGTHKLGWRPPVETRANSLSRRIATAFCICLLVAALHVATIFGLTAWQSSLWTPDCSGRRLFAQPVFPEHAVFTARLLRVGHSTKVSGRWAGNWAIGIVQDRFWGLPWWNPRLVLLTNNIFWEGETYFIDGRRAEGLLTRRLPIVVTGPCSRTRPVREAIVDLRVLRETSFSKGAHIIGYVQKPEPFTGGLRPPTAHAPFAGAEIMVTGPIGKRIVTTDPSGIYHLDDLPPGDYTLKVLVPENQLEESFIGEGLLSVHLNSQDLVERNFYAFWNGRIEGHVEDDSGKPAHIWLMLLNADQSRLPGSAIDFVLTNDDGSFQIKKIPPGRYIIMVNPSGPHDEWPYDIQYYPASLRANAAQVLQVAEGQQIKGVNFTVHRLTERTVQVRVTWLNGSAAANTPVCVAYEHTKEYDSLESTNSFTKTDQNGLAVVHLYGKSRVRLFAEQSVVNDKKKWWDTYYSHPVESEVGKIPDAINLVLTSSKP